MLEIVNISKCFVKSGSAKVLNELNLSIQKGEFFSLLGSSGCGKTTLLRILAGFESADSGQILLNGKNILELPPQQRPFNMVFQRYALFPHLSVFDNVAFGLRMKKVSETEIRQRVFSALELVNMKGFSERRPETLSGGQSQRVALARALINEPQILLLDEPLSALDLKMREHMQTELRELQKRLGLTFIYVTHDQEEAFALSDRVAVMNKGGLEQIGPPEELYLNPKTFYAAQFVGAMSTLPLQEVSEQGEWVHAQYEGQILRGRRLNDSAMEILENEAHGGQLPRRVQLLVRPEKIHLVQGPQPALEYNSLSVKVIGRTFKGPRVEIEVQTSSGDRMKVAISSSDPMGISTEPVNQMTNHLWLRFSPQDTFIHV